MSLFGRLFRVMTFGESHARGVGCVIEGFPSNFSLNMQELQKELARRRPGQSALTTPRKEDDVVECVSGMENGRTLGSPLCFMVRNKNIKAQDYDQFASVPRPGHADLTYLRKYGIKASSGGGRSSARETVGRVIAGGIAKQYLSTLGISFSSWVLAVHNARIPSTINQQYIRQKVNMEEIEEVEVGPMQNDQWMVKTINERYIYERMGSGEWQKQNPTGREQADTIPLRCPHPLTSIQMYHNIRQAQEKKDSMGGLVQGCVYGLPIGLGNPTFDKLPALMAHAIMSLPATKGFQYGSGFDSATMLGSEHNDMLDSNLNLSSNHSGGTLGGISTGETFQFKVAFKPVSTIGKPQTTHDLQGNKVILEGKGRHDPCVLPRTPPIIDSMAAIVIMDLVLSHKAGI